MPYGAGFSRHQWTLSATPNTALCPKPTRMVLSAPSSWKPSLRAPLNDRNEIAILNMRDSWPGDQPAGEGSADIGIHRFLDAVGGEQNCSREAFEFLALILPGAAEVTNQMLVFLQSRVAMSGQHFAMSIDMMPLPSVASAVPPGPSNRDRDDDCLPLEWFDPHRSRQRMAVSAGIGCIQQAHNRQVDFAYPQRRLQKGIYGRIVLG